MPSVRSTLRRSLLAIFLGLLLFVAVAPLMQARAAPQAPSAQQAPASAGEKTTPPETVPGQPGAASKPETKAEDEDKQYRESPMVAKIGSMMGMGPAMSSVVFTLINLLILLVGVGYMIAKIVPKALRSRSSGIQKQLVDARTATEEATARLNSVEERLSKLDEQIAGMRTQADADSVRDEQRIKASLEDEKVRILAAADAEIQSATTQARREIQTYAAELAIEQAARKLVISAETDRLLVESFANRLGDKGGQN